MSQASVVDANIHARVLLFDSSKHGQNLLLVPQVTFERNQNAAVALNLALGCQFLKGKQKITFHITPIFLFYSEGYYVRGSVASLRL